MQICNLDAIDSKYRTETETKEALNTLGKFRNINCKTESKTLRFFLLLCNFRMLIKPAIKKYPYNFQN